MTIQLYSHQETFIGQLKQALSKHKCVMAQAATGFGKTQVGAFMIKGAVEKGKRTFFCVHRKELIEQTCKTLDKIGVEYGVIQGGRRYDDIYQVYVVSIDTLKRRLDKIAPPDLMIIDESHHCGSRGWMKVHAWAKEAGAFIVGLTATPWRLDKKGLEMYFDEMVKGPTIEWLMANKYLSEYKAFAPSVPDMSETTVKMGDFEIGEVEAMMRDNILYGCAIDNWKRLAAGKKTIAFAPTILVSKELVDLFTLSGVRAAHLDGETPTAIRKHTIMAFANGEIDIISNVGLFGEGFDLSAIAGREVPIEAVILYRPTQSLSLHLQMIGRALRPKPLPALILDHAGNCLRHGLPDMEFNWTLKGSKKDKKNTVPTIEVKQCPKCYACHKPAPKCPSCGYEAPKKERDIGQVDGDLVEINKAALEALKKQKKKELIAAKTFEELVALGQSRQYKYPRKWAEHILNGRQAWKARR